MEERRTFIRTQYREPIRFNIVEDATQGTRDAISESVNISGGGIRIATPRPLAASHDIALELHIPGYVRPIPVRGEVVWSNPGQEQNTFMSGIRFTNINSFDRQMILDYVHFDSIN